MDLINDIEIYFQSTSMAELFYSLLYDSMDNNIFSQDEKNKKLYLLGTQNIFNNLSDSEIEIHRISSIDDMTLNGEISPFNLLKKFTFGETGSDGTLTIINDELLCRHEKIFDWQAMTNKIGQDILTCSFLAYREYALGTKNYIFSYPAVLKNDNSNLKKFFDKSIAENHFHLGGSTRIFELTWIQIMNYPYIIEKLVNTIIEQPTGEFKFGWVQEEYEFVKWLKRAVAIRAYLFNIILNKNYPKIDLMEKFNFNNLTLEFNNISTLQFEYGYPFSENNGILDYAILKNLNDKNYNSNRSLVGERYFLYNCFLNVFKNEFTNELKNYFYLYLLIKSRLFLQIFPSNRKPGLVNFQKYHGRKKIIEEDPLYSKETINLSIISTLNEQKIFPFECRIPPKLNSIKNVNTSFETLQNSDISFNKKEIIYPYFFTLSFLKKQDNNTEDNNSDIMPCKCRHYELRNDLKDQAIKLKNSLSKDSNLKKIIKGIDASSNEIVCRPEVMAVVFRYLSSGIPKNKYTFDEYKPFILRRTFHVGEDYDDLTDGLRAVDEAITFLGLANGDRIGHGLALGIKPEEYYNSKRTKINLKIQDLFDNIVWLLGCTNELNISINRSLKNKLEAKYTELFKIIYNSKTTEQSEVIYHAWKLRGDDPELYKDNGANNFYKTLDIFEPFFKNPYIPNNYRYDKSIKYYLKYHYDKNIRSLVNKISQFEVDSEYKLLLSDIQEKMRLLICNNDISIETNPTSNLLISNFGKYGNHPIFTFYNRHLMNKIKSIDLNVSINTDDQGVFQTSLENEFSLICRALELSENNNGRKKYNENKIYKWLESIRLMGINQSFNS